MRALILAAGIGKRMGGGKAQPPKVMAEIGGMTLLERHLKLLRGAGIDDVVIGVGYRAGLIEAELGRVAAGNGVRTVLNPDFEEGSVVTLWTLRDALDAGGDVLVMDADVLYDSRLLERLCGSDHGNCFLLDRNIEPGEEPVKLCVRDGRLVEFRKQIDAALEYDYFGESVGFFRFTASMARRLAARAGDYVTNGERNAPHEEALRDLLLEDGGASFGFEDITGLPWVEVDFPEDLQRARGEIFERLSD